MKTVRTHGDILCVDGDLKMICKIELLNRLRNLRYWLDEDIVWVFHFTYRKCMFNTHTVVHTDNETNIIVNSKYFPSNGTANDVGGIISANRRKNTVKDTRIEIHNVTCQRFVCKSIRRIWCKQMEFNCIALYCINIARRNRCGEDNFLFIYTFCLLIFVISCFNDFKFKYTHTQTILLIHTNINE